MKTFKNYASTHLRLIKIDALEVVILLITFLITDFFNMITGINGLKTLTKHISCECKCKFDHKIWC